MRIGLLGGTFDPIHTGHLVLAQECWHKLNLDKVIFIPAYIPPHKELESDVAVSDRLNMVRLALESDDRFEISSYEIDKKDTSYSIDTLRYFSEKCGDEDELFFLLGADLVEGLSAWKEPEELFELACFVVCTRPGWDESSQYKDRIQYIEIPSIDVSSSMIRARIKNREPIDYLVPEVVVKYIRNKGLYRDSLETNG